MISKEQKKRLNKFFPSEEILNPIVNKNEVRYLAIRLNKFYPIIIRKLLKVYKEKFKKNNLELILRRCLVPMTYIFFERCIRSINNKKRIKPLDGMYRFGDFYKTDDFDNAVSTSINFNYFLNHNFLYLLKNKKNKIIKNIKVKNDFINFEVSSRKNYLSNYYGYYKKIINLFLRKIESVVNFFFFKKKILSLGLANAETALTYKGFYIFNLSRLSEPKYEKNDYNKYLRAKLFSKLGNFYDNFTKVLINYKLSKQQLNSLYKYYILFLKENFPKFFLEDFEKNYSKCNNFLNKFKKKIIISSDIDNSSSTLIFLVARNLKFKNVKIQHGGHYGYVNDSYVNEIELKNCDEFLTYGWKYNLNNSSNRKIKFLAMPSPWLSEKKKDFVNLNLNCNKKFDFIYFPQFIKPFTNNIQGSSHFRRDVLNNYIKRLLQICKNSFKNNSNIGIKLFNEKSNFFLKQTIKNLNFKYPNNVNFLPFYDKGLSKYILNQTNLIIFDQVGTGVIECFSYGIPVMIIHNTDYNMPNKLGVKYFRKLEESGILHKNVRSLFKEYNDFKKSPELWMNNKERKESIKLFCKKFSFTDVEWATKFKSYFIAMNKLY